MLNEPADIHAVLNGNGGTVDIDASPTAPVAHGDTVIPDAMAILALYEQPKAMIHEMMHILEGSMQHRRWAYEKQIKNEGKNSQWLR